MLKYVATSDDNLDSYATEVFDFKGNGAAYVTRTRDPVITNDVLYQLS